MKGDGEGARAAAADAAALAALWQLRAADVRRLSPKGDDHCRLQVGRAHAAASAHIERALTPAAPSLSVRRRVVPFVSGSSQVESSAGLSALVFLHYHQGQGDSVSVVRPSARPSGWPSVLAIFVFVFPRQLQSDATRQLQCFLSFSPGWPARRRILVHPAAAAACPRRGAGPSGRSCVAEAADDEEAVQWHALTHSLAFSIRVLERQKDQQRSR